MYIVKLTTNSADPLLRQTPGLKGRWGDYRFVMNSDIEECDFWVVYEGLLKPEKVRCPKENTIFITGEPASIRKYDADFLKQFSMIITSRRDLDHSNIVNYQQSLPWHIGLRQKKNIRFGYNLDYDELNSMRKFEKKKLISVISSDKGFTDGHIKRIEFVNKLKEHFGDMLQVFGRGVCEIEDKWDAIADYKYHIVIENSSYPDYWTEKLSDTLLAGAYPIYYGCPNLSDYFSCESFTPIDIDNFDESISIIQDVMADNKYEQSIEEIAYARWLVLNKYNLFPMVVDFCNKKTAQRNKKTITIYPGKVSGIKSKFINKIKSYFRFVKKIIPIK